MKWSREMFQGYTTPIYHFAVMKCSREKFQGNVPGKCSREMFQGNVPGIHHPDISFCSNEMFANALLVQKEKERLSGINISWGLVFN